TSSAAGGPSGNRNNSAQRNQNEPRSGVKSLARDVRGRCSTRESQLPSSAEEGKADAVAAAGVVLVKKIIILISTTPSARAKVASQLFSLPRSHPSSAEEGSCRPYVGQRPLAPWARF